MHVPHRMKCTIRHVNNDNHPVEPLKKTRGGSFAVSQKINHVRHNSVKKSQEFYSLGYSLSEREREKITRTIKIVMLQSVREHNRMHVHHNSK